MLDVSLVLQEAETLLDDHYTAWQQHGSSRVRVYHVPQKQQIPVTVTKGQVAGRLVGGHSVSPAVSAAPAPAKSAGISEVVANVVVLLLLNVLRDKLAKGGARHAR